VADAGGEGVDERGVVLGRLRSEHVVELVRPGSQVRHVGIGEGHLGPAARAGLGQHGEVVDDEHPGVGRAVVDAGEHVVDLGPVAVMRSLISSPPSPT
jgi:hypothetical protein